MSDRKELFNVYAEDYFKYRPYLPKEVGDFHIEKASLTSSSNILEIGCGTGQATLMFEGGNLHITSIDIGENLIDFAKKHDPADLNVDWVCSSFEDYHSESDHFDFVFSSMAIHWIDPMLAYQKIAKILGSKGYFSIVNLKRNYPEVLNKDLQQIYKNFPEIENFNLRPSNKVNLEDVTLERDKYFQTKQNHKISFNISYTADQYVGLMKTMSPHRSLESLRQESIYEQIGDIFGKHEPVIMENSVTIQLFQKLK